ncbi:MAG: MBL fold metallo-hydrolase [Bdellovibrionaceae bacterium]|nr:MBL fold metallo-hydrolase [Pseudobdellovibrionaceae bacterium]
MPQQNIFYQLFEHESSTYTYLIGDPVTKESAIIDPVMETVDRDLKLIDELGLKLKYILDTHVHADHITGAGEIRRRTGAKSAVSSAAQVACVDIPLTDGQELLLGDKKIKALWTPGHTDSCMCFIFGDQIFSGDTLLIRGTGRTDFQQGSSDRLYDSIHKKIFVLPDDTRIYPGHDYKGHTASTVGMEKKYNPRLGFNKTKDDFIKIMSELKLANPKKIHEAVPANLACGTVPLTAIPEVSIEYVKDHIGKVKIIDVRQADEFNAELGHIQSAQRVTLGRDLTIFLENGNRSEEIIFVCHSGGRSGQATAESKKLGYTKTFNMSGGMLSWNKAKLSVEREQ